MTRIENRKLLRDAATQLRRHSALEKIMTPPGQWWPKDYRKPGSWMLAAAEMLESEAREMTGCEKGACLDDCHWCVAIRVARDVLGYPPMRRRYAPPPPPKSLVDALERHR